MLRNVNLNYEYVKKDPLQLEGLFAFSLIIDQFNRTFTVRKNPVLLETGHLVFPLILASYLFHHLLDTFTNPLIATSLLAIR